MLMEMPFQNEMPYGTYVKKKTETAIRRKI